MARHGGKRVGSAAAASPAIAPARWQLGRHDVLFPI